MIINFHEELEKYHHRLEHHPLIIDNSTLDLWELCKRKFLYRVVASLVGGREAPALTFGSAIHAGLHTFYSGKTHDECLKAFIREARKEESQIQKLKSDAENNNLIGEYSLEFGITLLQKYIDSHPMEQEDFEVLKDDEGKHYLEIGFSVDLGEGVIVGKIDGIVQLTKIPQIWLMEHKTTKYSLNKDYLAKFNPNNQVTTYLLPISILIGKTAKGAIVNNLRVKEYKREGQDNKLFVRTRTTRTPGQVADRVAQIKCKMAEIKTAAKKGFCAFSQNAPNGCSAFFKRCEYEQLCIAQPDLRQYFLSGYRSDKWFPYEELKEVERVITGGEGLEIEMKKREEVFEEEEKEKENESEKED